MSFFIERERMKLAIVTYVIGARIAELSVAIGRIAGIHPLIVRLVYRRAVMPSGSGSEISLIFRQINFYRPQSACNQLVRRNIATYAAVRLLPSNVIYRRARCRRMTDNTEVKLNASRCPRTTHRYIAELHHMVVIDKLHAGSLIYSSPHLSSYLGEKSKLYIIVFKRNHFPLLIDSLSRETVETEIRIKQVRRVRHRVGVGKRICLNTFYRLCNSGFLRKQWLHH